MISIFPIVNFSFICSNIPAACGYGVYLSQLIRYSRACSSYHEFLDRVLLLTRKLLNQRFLLINLKSSHRKFCRKHFSSFMTYHRVCKQINITGATSGAGTAHPSGAHEFTLGFQWGLCYSMFSVICMLCRSLFVLLYFFFWSLCCLFFFDMRILITLWYLQTLHILTSFWVFAP